MNWVAYTHVLMKVCKLPSISINAYIFADKDAAYQWVEEQKAKYGTRVLKSKVIADGTV